MELSLGIDAHYVSTFSFSNSDISMAENSDVRGPHLFAFVVFFFFFFSTNQRSVDLDFEVFPIRSVFFLVNFTQAQEQGKKTTHTALFSAQQEERKNPF